MATSSISFWTVDSQEVANAFTYGGIAWRPATRSTCSASGCAASSPSSCPLAFVAYFPAARMLGKEQPLGLPNAIAWVTPLVAVLAVLVARAVWRTRRPPPPEHRELT